MDAVVTLIGPRPATLDGAIVAEARSALNARGAAVGATDWLAEGQAADIGYGGLTPADARSAILGRLGSPPIDIVAQPVADRRKRLMLSDMDATMVAEETLDEVAAEAGVGGPIAAITARAMAGELDFTKALKERVRMLAGLPEEVLERVFRRVTINPGAETAVRTMAANGCHTVLVTGGFDFFTSRLAARIGFFVILLAPFAGGLIAEAIRAVTGKRRAPNLFRVAAAGVALGAAPFLLFPLMAMLSGAGLGALISLLWPGVYLFIVTSTAYVRLSGMQLGG